MDLNLDWDPVSNVRIDCPAEDRLPFKKNRITLSYPPGPSNEYLVECLIAAIQEDLPNFEISCPIPSQSIQSLILNHNHPEHHPATNPGEDQTIGSIQWSDYDSIDWSFLKSFTNQTLVNAYPIRKALIRKNYLIKAVESYHVKNSLNPNDQTSSRVLSIPKSYSFTLCCSDELDELWIDELYDLNIQLLEQESKLDQLNKENQRKTGETKIWILKPALADKGQGIRLFETKDQLRQIFLEFERLEDQELERLENLEDSRTEENEPQEIQKCSEDNFDHLATCVSVSQIRDWIIQEYIANPLLIDPHKPETYSRDKSINRSPFSKHHLRVYVLAVGALSVYVFEDSLSLFSTQPYTLNDLENLKSHITNTCLQVNQSYGNESLEKEKISHGANTKLNRDGCHQEDPIVSFKLNHPNLILDQIDSIISNLFTFVSQNDPINFHLHPNCFELFGFDFLVDSNFKVWLLEVNAGPDFGQSGEDLKPMIKKLISSSINVLKTRYHFMNEDKNDQPPTYKQNQSSKDLNNLKPSSFEKIEITDIPSKSSFPGFRHVLNLQSNFNFF